MKNTNNCDRIFFRFDNPVYLRIIRENAERLARQMGFGDDESYEFGVAVDEAYTNAIEHGGKSTCQPELEVEFLVYSDRMEVSVKDTGCGFDFSHARVPENLQSLDSVRGRGIGLMSMLSDKLEFASSPETGTIVRIIKYLTDRARRIAAHA